MVTVEEWLYHHIDLLTGVEDRTASDYRSYVRNDVPSVLLRKPLADLSREDIARWIQHLQARGQAGKTIANKFMFVNAALRRAQLERRIEVNPADGIRLPRKDPVRHMHALTPVQFKQVHAEITEHYQPLVEFLVTSGCRWGEATALRPEHVDRVNGLVTIQQAWKYHSGHGYHVGLPKSPASRRTINVDPDTLTKLDYDHEWLFTTVRRHAVRIHNFHPNIWKPAVAAAELGFLPRIHDLRHTCASWMIHAGIPLEVVQQHLGHESIQTTRGTYVHLERTSLRAAADAVGQFLRTP